MEMDGPLVATGNWSENLSWELYATSTLPPAELCTAVMAVAIADNKVVLARSERGWGMLGGHIEEGETLGDTLIREAREEGGFIIDAYRPFAVRRITAKTPEPNRTGTTYPFPTAYMVYYWAVTDHPLEEFTGEEIIESDSFALADIGTLETPDWPVIEAGWNEYSRHQTAMRSIGGNT